MVSRISLEDMSIQIAGSNPASNDIKKGPSAEVVEISPNAISNDASFDNDQLPKQLVDVMQAIFKKHQNDCTSEYSDWRLQLMLMLLPQPMSKVFL